MKKNFIAPVAIALLAVSLFSCTKETVTPLKENTPVATTGNNNSSEFVQDAGKAATVQNSVILSLFQKHQWYVGSFMINGSDLTAGYADINFQFNPDGSAIATKSPVSLVGLWDMPDDTHVHFAFPPKVYIGDLKILNENWKISRITDESVFLKYDYLLVHKVLRLDMKDFSPGPRD